MSLDKKLAEIHRKPEHVRKRYVWISVILCMIFVLIIWFFSIKTNFSHTNTDSTEAFTTIQEQFDEAGEPLPQMPSIEDFVTTEEQAPEETTSEAPFQEQQKELPDTNATQTTTNAPVEEEITTVEGLREQE